MARSSHPAIAIVNALLVPLGVVVLVAGVVGALTVREMWWAFALMAVGGAVVVHGAARGIGQWRRAVGAEDATGRAMLAAVRAEPHLAARAEGAVLAHWTYDAAAWRAHRGRELSRRLRESAVMAGTIVLCGGALIGVLERDWRLGLQVALATGVTIGGGNAAVAYFRYRREASPAGGDVVIGPDAVLVNGRYHVLDDDRIRFGEARVREGGGPALLCITLWLPGQYRSHPDDLRISIPPGREDEARRVAEALNRAHQGRA